MSPTFQYLTLVAVGLVSGFMAHQLAASVRGSLKKQFLLRYLAEGISVVPGITLAMVFLNQRGPSFNLFDVVNLEGTFVLPYAAARIAFYRWDTGRTRRRENVLPFQHWFDLLRTDPGAAQQFLAAYLAEQESRGSDLLAELHAARASLERHRMADPLLPTAVQRLRAEIARMEHSRARLPNARGFQ